MSWYFGVKIFPCKPYVLWTLLDSATVKEIVMQGSILPVTIPPPPGQPRGQVQPLGPGGGELFEAVLSQGEGGGANRI